MAKSRPRRISELELIRPAGLRRRVRRSNVDGTRRATARSVRRTPYIVVRPISARRIGCCMQSPKHRSMMTTSQAAIVRWAANDVAASARIHDSMSGRKDDGRPSDRRQFRRNVRPRRVLPDASSTTSTAAAAHWRGAGHVTPTATRDQPRTRGSLIWMDADRMSADGRMFR